MEAAKCRVCGVRHWSSEPHKWGEEPKKAVLLKLRAVMANATSVANKPMANTETLANSVANERLVMANSRSSSTGERRFCKPKVAGSIPVSGSTYKYRDVEKRRSYQREYMKRRRSGRQDGIRQGD